MGPPPEREPEAAALVPAVAGDARLPYHVFLAWNASGGLVWGVLHVGWYAHGQITDYGVYQAYGDSIVTHHDVPYRDFSVEYPPAALPGAPGRLARRRVRCDLSSPRSSRSGRRRPTP